MKFLSSTILLLASTPFLNALSIPETFTSVSRRIFDPEAYLPETPVSAPNHDLVKRKGGGGGGRGGGSGSSSSSSSGGARAGSGSTGSSGGPRAGSGFGRTVPYYGGGAMVPYRSGGRTPRGLLPIGLFAGAAIFPGLWLASVYGYNLSPYRFYNASAQQNETKPVTCLCQQYSECGCDDNEDQEYIESLIGNGSYAALDKSLVQVANVNGTERILINGTLENGTLAAAATEGDTSTSAGMSGKQRVLEFSGFWVVGAIVGYAVWFI